MKVRATNVSVFTEQGVAMLSGVLNSGRAIQMNIAIMRICKASGNAVLKQGTCSQVDAA